MSTYIYRDDKPAEDMTARDHYIKASIIAGYIEEKTLDPDFCVVADSDKLSLLVDVALIHARLAEVSVNGREVLPEDEAGYRD